MQTANPLLDDVARLANGMLGMAAGLRQEAEGALKARLQALLAEMNHVARDEFEAVRDMAAKARAEQEILGQRLAALEARVAALEAARKG